MEVAATGIVRANRMENDPLQDMVKTKKEKRESSDVVTDVSSNITAVRWKDNKVIDFQLNWQTTNSTGQTLLSSLKTKSEYWSTKHPKPK